MHDHTYTHGSLILSGECWKKVAAAFSNAGIRIAGAYWDELHVTTFYNGNVVPQKEMGIHPLKDPVRMRVKDIRYKEEGTKVKIELILMPSQSYVDAVNRHLINYGGTFKSRDVHVTIGMFPKHLQFDVLRVEDFPIMEFTKDRILPEQRAQFVKDAIKRSISLKKHIANESKR